MMAKAASPGRVLVVAGSDSGGGAGIQADIKTITMLGGYAATALTAVTVQNSQGVQGVVPMSTECVGEQMSAVLGDIGADVIKTGMLGSSEIIRKVADIVARDAADAALVVDPVMVAKGGAALLAEDAVIALRDLLLPLATIVTPNLPEAEAMLGARVGDVDDMRRAAKEIVGLGATSVLLKGGHLAGDEIVDVLLTGEGETLFRERRIDTRHTHGTGCTLASAIAAGLAGGRSIPDSVARARGYVRRAIETAPGFGAGHGPLNHMCDIQ